MGKVQPGRRATRRRAFGTVRVRRLSAPPSVVMERLRRPSTWPGWQPEILSTEGPERVGPGDEVDGAARLLGFEVHGRSKVVVVAEDAFEQEVVVGVRMRVRYELRADGEGTVLTHHLRARLPGGPSGRVLSLLLRPRLRQMQREAVANLARMDRATP